MDYPWSYDELTQTVLVHKSFNDELTGLPVDTKTIIFHRTLSIFNCPIKKNNLPPNVQRIEFGAIFNQPVSEDNLPSNITHLTFGYFFNQRISTLPNSITHLTFGLYYKQPINESLLPNSLTHLTFGMDFNQSLDMLPVNLTHLSIKNPDYSKTLNNLPCSLKILEISKYYPIEKIKLPFGCKVIKKN
jgi:hypothetical protein